MAAPSALRQRTLTALALGPLVLAAVLWLPTWAFGVFLALVVLASAWEWGALAGIWGARRLAYLSLVALALALLWWFPGLRPWLTGIGVLWWVAQTVRIARIRTIVPRSGFDLQLLAAGLLVLSAPWGALVDLHLTDPKGPSLVLFLMLLVWTADSLAYFVGRRWGRTKLAPVVSPGKTRAGVYGALGGAALCGLVFGLSLSLGFAATLLAALVCSLTVLFSVVGDLYESLVKRCRGVKDSSHLLPGHGGLLDRVDSLTAAAPVFALCLSLLGWPL